MIYYNQSPKDWTDVRVESGDDFHGFRIPLGFLKFSVVDVLLHILAGLIERV